MPQKAEAKLLFDDVEEALDLADDAAAENTTRLSHDEVFGNLRTTAGSKEDFDAMMQAGYDDALANRSGDADVVFARIRQRIAKYGNNSQNVYKNEALTQEQIKLLEEADKKPIIFDEDCPELTEIQLMEIAAMAAKQRIERHKGIRLSSAVWCCSFLFIRLIFDERIEK